MRTDRIRTTISLDPEVHSVFVQMAEAAGTSVSRCMGDWLADTADGAQFVALKMQEARKAPKTVMRELQAMSAGLHDLVGDHIGKHGSDRDAASQRTGGDVPSVIASQALARARFPAAPRPIPPSSNTGGKYPGKTLQATPKRSAK